MKHQENVPYKRDTVVLTHVVGFQSLVLLVSLFWSYNEIALSWTPRTKETGRSAEGTNSHLSIPPFIQPPLTRALPLINSTITTFRTRALGVSTFQLQVITLFNSLCEHFNIQYNQLSLVFL